MRIAKVVSKQLHNVDPAQSLHVQTLWTHMPHCVFTIHRPHLYKNELPLILLSPTTMPTTSDAPTTNVAQDTHGGAPPTHTHPHIDTVTSAFSHALVLSDDVASCVSSGVNTDTPLPDCNETHTRSGIEFYLQSQEAAQVLLSLHQVNRDDDLDAFETALILVRMSKEE